MDQSPGQLRLPLDLTRPQVDRRVQKYAPFVKLHKDERHLPSLPEWLRVVARFRDSVAFGRDRGWDKHSDHWQTSDSEAAKFFNIPWPEIIAASMERYEENGTLDPPSARNIRPYDSNSIHRDPDGAHSNEGLFLERRDTIDRNASGLTPLGDEIIAPVFFDLFQAADGWVRVLYWFYYELNLWHGFLTHEGDWEHITYYFRPEDFRAGDPPDSVFFAQHNTGEIRNWAALTKEEGHPVVYVDPAGHPTRASVGSPGEFTRKWRTWDRMFVAIPEAPWRDFPGAWGEVGFTKHTTGPLGPYFKRRGDRVAVKMQGGKLNLVLTHK